MSYQNPYPPHEKYYKDYPLPKTPITASGKDEVIIVEPDSYILKVHANRLAILTLAPKMVAQIQELATAPLVVEEDITEHKEESMVQPSKPVEEGADGKVIDKSKLYLQWRQCCLNTSKISGKRKRNAPSIVKGTVLFTISRGDRRISVRSPIKGFAIEYNSRLETCPELLLTRPHAEGWCLIMTLHASAYKQLTENGDTTKK